MALPRLWRNRPGRVLIVVDRQSNRGFFGREIGGRVRENDAAQLKFGQSKVALPRASDRLANARRMAVISFVNGNSASTV